MKTFAELIALIVLVVPWIAGIVIASGFWSTFISIIFPFYSWYLVIERVMSVNGLT